MMVKAPVNISTARSVTGVFLSLLYTARLFGLASSLVSDEKFSENYICLADLNYVKVLIFHLLCSISYFLCLFCRKNVEFSIHFARSDEGEKKTMPEHNGKKETKKKTCENLCKRVLELEGHSKMESEAAQASKAGNLCNISNLKNC